MLNLIRSRLFSGFVLRCFSYRTLSTSESEFSSELLMNEMAARILVGDPVVKDSPLVPNENQTVNCESRNRNVFIMDPPFTEVPGESEAVDKCGMVSVISLNDHKISCPSALFPSYCCASCGESLFVPFREFLPSNVSSLFQHPSGWPVFTKPLHLSSVISSCKKFERIEYSNKVDYKENDTSAEEDKVLSKRILGPRPSLRVCDDPSRVTAPLIRKKEYFNVYQARLLAIPSKRQKIALKEMELAKRRERRPAEKSVKKQLMYGGVCGKCSCEVCLILPTKYKTVRYQLRPSSICCRVTPINEIILGLKR